MLTISEADIEEMSSVLQSRVVTEVVSQVQGMLKQLGSVTLNIAVTGESGSGKSSFVHVFRGVADDSPGAAQTGVTEITSEALAYTHPSVPTITLWDLPGIGTPTFKPDTYLEQVGFLQYDFFIIVGSERFREYHIQLANAIRQAGKRLYFVRNKVDSDLEALFRRRSGKGLTEADILSQIRADCEVNLRKAGVKQAKVFLLSCFQPQSFDFHLLQTTIEKELEGHKRHVFLLTLPNRSSAVIESKKTALAGTVWKRAIEAC
ncbi:interferon-inducible GTPase 5-like [Coregonus clupeaformis]|uniref:interferon-inducible GTPase 5-like n=1 Tax=Coregonus clupeaformis TaxID=59861 RepID=UPI001E1C3646|nr:interferon-inducible GTPase 5-like [Coregonus clupeaformis]